MSAINIIANQSRVDQCYYKILWYFICCTIYTHTSYIIYASLFFLHFRNVVLISLQQNPSISAVYSLLNVYCERSLSLLNTVAYCLTSRKLLANFSQINLRARSLFPTDILPHFLFSKSDYPCFL